MSALDCRHNWQHVAKIGVDAEFYCAKCGSTWSDMKITVPTPTPITGTSRYSALVSVLVGRRNRWLAQCPSPY